MTLSLNNFIQLENFGHSLRAPSYHFRPSRVEEICEVFRIAEQATLFLSGGHGRCQGEQQDERGSHEHR